MEADLWTVKREEEEEGGRSEDLRLDADRSRLAHGREHRRRDVAAVCQINTKRNTTGHTHHQAALWQRKIQSESKYGK